MKIVITNFYKKKIVIYLNQYNFNDETFVLELALFRISNPDSMGVNCMKLQN